jgi:hypothetical protein
MKFIKLFHLVVGHKVTAAGSVHTLQDGCSLVVGKAIHTGTARLYLASYSREFLLVLFGPGLDLFQQCLGSGAHKPKIAYSGVPCHLGLATIARSGRLQQAIGLG